MLPTWIFIVCVLAGRWALKQPERMLPVMVVSCGFGASAAMEVVLLGSAPISPALFFVPFLWFAAWRAGQGPAIAGAVSLREPGGWLLLYTAWLSFSAVFMPRLLEGESLVYITSRATAALTGVELLPLAPNSTNLTQGAYAVLGLAIFMGIRALSAKKDMGRWALNAVFAATTVNLIMVVWDALQAFTGLDLGLSLVRNANYAVVSQSVGGWPRLQGAFSEPAAMAGFTLAPYTILLALWLRGVQPAKTGLLAGLSAIALVSTLSSTALVSIVVVTVLVLLCHLWGQLNMERRSPRFGVVTAVFLGLVSAACVLVLWWPNWLQRIADISWTMVFEKAESTSGQERLQWALGTWQNFLDSWGLGTGTGSARGSSYPLVVLGNAGLPGLLLVMTFLGLCLFKPARLAQEQGAMSDPDASMHRHMLFAFRMGLVGRLIPLSLSGTMIDPGPMFYVIAGVVAGLLVSSPSVTRQEQREDGTLGEVSDTPVHLTAHNT
ncbi:MAG: hypothetical protein LW854_18140 [Rubrivivax sp.]|jgi:hypothetical protein|nr:hypothetical protein [Rubrivivax sp.]